MRVGSILVLCVAFSLLSATPVRATIYYFPYTPLFPRPYTPDEYTLIEGQSIYYSGNPFADRVIIGYAPGTNPFSLPYPYREPYKTIVNVSNGVTIQPPTLVYAGSTLNLLAGSQMNGGTSDYVGIYDDSTLNVTGAAVQGSVTVYSNGKVNLTNATMNANVTGSATSTITVTNSIVYGQMVTGNSFSTSGSTFGSLVTTGSASATMNTGQVLRGASALETSTMTLTEIDLTSSISAHNYGVMEVFGGSVGGDVHANHFSLVSLSGGVEIGIGAYAYGGTLVLADGTIAGGVTVGPHPAADGGTGTFLMSGGTVSSGLDVDAGAVALVSGGVINGQTFITGGHLTNSAADFLGNVDVSQGGTITMASGYVSGHLDVSSGGMAHISDGTFGGGVVAVGGTVQLSGGTVGGDVVVSTDGTDGHFEMSDGFVAGGISAAVNGSVYIADGEVTGNSYFFEDARGTIAGGTFRGNIDASGDSEVNISGGLIEGNLLASDTATINMSGGFVAGYSLELHETATINLSGGTIFGDGGELPTEETLRGALNMTLDVTSVGAITAYDNAVINIYGTDLVATLLDSNYEGGFSQYSFSGMLADGTVINGGTFLLANGGGATYHFLPPPVPEPSTVALVIVPVLGYCFRRRPRRQISCE